MDEPEGIRIDELPPFASAQPTHQLPAMISGASGFLTIGQILDITVGDPPAELDTLEKLIDALGADGTDGPVVGTVTPAGALIAAMFKGAGNALDAIPVTVPTAGNSVPAALAARFVPGSTDPVTVSVRVGAASGVARMNGNASGRLLGGAAVCTLIVKEIMSA
ncbi:hypothetical protein [Rhizobium laguerreae]|uniref:hypothetical protein n=1 Tax=Rhizobium laguerreae TaxID=1076926 RepID=UPI00300B99D3